MMKFSDFTTNLRGCERLFRAIGVLASGYWEFQLKSLSALFKSLSKVVPKSSFSEIFTSFDQFWPSIWCIL